MSHSDSPITCLENLIGLDTGCASIESTSGYYASQVGITKNFLSQILTSDFKDEEALFLARRSFATNLVAKAVHTHFSPKYRAVSVIDSFRAGKYHENKVVMDAVSKYKGILFDYSHNQSYLDFFLSEVSLFINHTGVVPVLIFDLMQGIVLDTVTVNAVAGEISSVFPHQLFASRERDLQLFIAYDATGIQSYKTTMHPSSCSSCLPAYRVSNSYETISSVTLAIGSDPIKSNVSHVQDTGGLSVVHSLQCNHKDWLCSRSNQVAEAILYKTAALILEFALLESPNYRTNTTDSLNYDLLKQRFELAESRFASSMDRFLQSANPPKDELCFECRKSAKMVIALP